MPSRNGMVAVYESDIGKVWITRDALRQLKAKKSDGGDVDAWLEAEPGAKLTQMATPLAGIFRWAQWEPLEAVREAAAAQGMAERLAAGLTALAADMNDAADTGGGEGKVSDGGSS